MSSLIQVLQQEINPFDPTTHKIFSFWDEPYKQTPIVEAIHQSVIAEVEAIFAQIERDHVTRSLILAGDSGAGKSIVLGRLRDRLNDRAVFAYISHWDENEYVWRHTLRCVVDSLLQVPSGQTEPQLVLWLRQLLHAQGETLQRLWLGERKLFIQNLKAAYPVGIYNPNDFFGVLYDLLNADHSSIAAEWLRGDDLDEEDLKTLKVKKAIDSESVARKVMSNLGRIAAHTSPIVLCFDNLDNVPKHADGALDLQPLFDINTTLHSQSLKNFLVVISLVTNNWKTAVNRIQQADRASIHKLLALRSVSLEQAEQLWAARLAPLHQRAQPQPNSPIAPLTSHQLNETFPAGKANPRSVMQLGYKLIERYRQLPPPPPPPSVEPPAPSPSPTSVVPVLPSPSERLTAAFKLLWRQEQGVTQQKITQFKQIPSPELVLLLRNALTILQVTTYPRLLSSSTYASHSFSYEPTETDLQPIGVIWTEGANLTSFCTIMKAAEAIDRQSGVQRLYLIRKETVGKPTNKGNQLYRRLFSQSPHQHFVPDLATLHDLVTADRLTRTAKAGDLLLLDRTVSLPDLESLFRDTAVLSQCRLLQQLGVVEATSQPDAGNGTTVPVGSTQPIADVRQFVLDFITQHQILSQGTIVKQVHHQYVDISDDQIYALIQELCQSDRIRILDDRQPVPDQIICFVSSHPPLTV